MSQTTHRYGHWLAATGAAGSTLALARLGIWRLNLPDNATDLIKREGFGSFHVGGAHFVLCGGSVRFISENIDNSSRDRNAHRDDPFDRANNGADYRTYQRLFSRNGGYPIGAF